MFYYKGIVMRKKMSQKEMVEKTLEKIKRLFPKTRSVTVNLTQDKNGLYHSKIEIKTNARKTFVVQKVGNEEAVKSQFCSFQ